MNSRQNIYCNDRRYSYGVATVAVSELISDTATARPKQQGWARDRDVSISRQSRDLSMVSSRCSARTSRPRLGLESLRLGLGQAKDRFLLKFRCDGLILSPQKLNPNANN